MPGHYIGGEDTPMEEVTELNFDEDGECIGVRVVGARVAGTAYDRVRLVDVELVRCDLAGCDFSEASLHRVKLVDCRGGGVDFGSATWHTVTATDCRFEEANFRLTRLTQVHFEASNCGRADFGGARLEDVKLPDCDLRAADFSNAKCTQVDLRTARLDDLRGVGSLRGATIGVDQLFGLAPGLATAAGMRVLTEDESIP